MKHPKIKAFEEGKRNVWNIMKDKCAWEGNQKENECSSYDSKNKCYIKCIFENCPLLK